MMSNESGLDKEDNCKQAALPSTSNNMGAYACLPCTAMQINNTDPTSFASTELSNSNEQNQSLLLTTSSFEFATTSTKTPSPTVLMSPPTTGFPSTTITNKPNETTFSFASSQQVTTSPSFAGTHQCNSGNDSESQDSTDTANAAVYEAAVVAAQLHAKEERSTNYPQH
ncbi:hypothetical protein ACA910_001520 [Epithemia clementina (nom. ined.)]